MPGVEGSNSQTHMDFYEAGVSASWSLGLLHTIGAKMDLAYSKEVIKL